MQKNRLNFGVDHNKNAEWIMTVEKELACVTQQGNTHITKEDISIHLREIPNWKAQGPDGLHEFWLKKFTSLHQAMVKHLCLYQNRGCSQLDARKSDSPYTERCKKRGCCW